MTQGRSSRVSKEEIGRIRRGVVAASDARQNLRVTSQLLEAARNQSCGCSGGNVSFELVVAAEREVRDARELLDKVNA